MLSFSLLFIIIFWIRLKWSHMFWTTKFVTNVKVVVVAVNLHRFSVQMSLVCNIIVNIAGLLSTHALVVSFTNHSSKKELIALELYPFAGAERFYCSHVCHVLLSVFISLFLSLPLSNCLLNTLKLFLSLSFSTFSLHAFLPAVIRVMKLINCLTFNINCYTIGRQSTFSSRLLFL